jgi:uncharacterized membrane protein YqjE
MAVNERSISDVIQDIIGNIQQIVRSEVRLAKTEIREEAAKAKSAGILTGSGVVAAFFAADFLLLAIVYALATVMPNWAAALIVGGTLAIAGYFTISAGIKQFQRVHPAPERTVESMKENVQWVQQQTK